LNHFLPSTTPDEGTGVLFLFHLIDGAVPAFFAPDLPIVVARAPGRLDVMGGIADYSGSLVLQLPLAEAACVAVQGRPDDRLYAWSPGRDPRRSQLVSMQLGDLGLPDRPLPYGSARALFAQEPRDRWAAYVLGALLVLAKERGLRPRHGAAILLRSDVPEGKGVASSAAIEVAAMRALAEHYGVALPGRELALLCQRVENEVVGAPCGVMDQMTAACGEQDELLALRCQPCELEGQVALPGELEAIGIDSGVRHEVSGERYADVRAGAAIGGRILASLRGLGVRRDGDLVVADDPEWGGWLANCDAAEYRARWDAALPDTVLGAEFLEHHGGHGDALARVEPGRRYAVRAATRHPIEENERARRFRALLEQPLDGAARAELGDLMFGSHASYSACGLGHEATDFLVDEVRQRRARGAGVHGARVTGGGCGGTVVVLGERGQVWHEALRIKKAMLQHRGHAPEIFRWSSPGAMSFGVLHLLPKN
jgi:L-arabinokinase